MVTSVAHAGNPAKPVRTKPGARYDNYFFSSLALLILATVFVGFAPTYYLAGVFRAPLPSLIIHLHGAVFSCWVLLLVTQTSLVSAGRVDMHRRLGLAGFLLAVLMVVLGVLAATDSLVHERGPVGRDARFFYIIPLSNMLSFATLIYFAFRARFHPSAHKRFILLATVSLTVAALVRWPFALLHGHVFVAMLFSDIFVLVLVVYDVWSMRRVHRATLGAGAFLIIVQQLSIPIGATSAWHAFAGWVQSIAR